MQFLGYIQHQPSGGEVLVASNAEEQVLGSADPGDSFGQTRDNIKAWVAQLQAGKAARAEETTVPAARTRCSDL